MQPSIMVIIQTKEINTMTIRITFLLLNLVFGILPAHGETSQPTPSPAHPTTIQTSQVPTSTNEATKQNASSKSNDGGNTAPVGSGWG